MRCGHRPYPADQKSNGLHELGNIGIAHNVEDVGNAPRLGRMRISPHVYNDEEDVERFVTVLAKKLRA